MIKKLEKRIVHIHKKNKTQKLGKIKKRKIRKKKELAEIKKNLPNLNAINLTNIELTQHQQSLLKKGPSFIPTTKDVNWLKLYQDFDKFTNQLRTRFNQAIEKSTEKNTNITTNNSSNSTRDNSNNNEQVSKKKYKTNNLYRSRETKNKHLENIKHVCSNLTYEERKALVELKSIENAVVRIQAKGSRFVLLTNEDYENKVEQQIARSSSKELPSDPSQEFERKVKLWTDKCQSTSLSNDWVKFITPENSKPGKIYGNIKTREINNPKRVIINLQKIYHHKLKIQMTC